MILGAPLSVPRRLLSVEEYYQLNRAGVLREDDRVELIEGEMIEMAPIGGPHIHLVNLLNKLFATQLGDHGFVSVQNPVILPPRNAPQPDLAILAPSSIASKEVPRAQDVLLLIEVAHTTADYDRDVKIPIYARHGIIEVWLFEVEAQRLSIYLEPAARGYQRQLRPAHDETVSPSLLPSVKISLADLW
jgi:Uma2 family endonuclease